MHSFLIWLAKISAVLKAFLLPLGVWGMGGAAIIDSSSLALPIDQFLWFYVLNRPHYFWLYCLFAAIGSSIGSLLPYFLGRAGGELFLLKRINRQRYENLRDRFEKQEFLAIFIPALLPPPFPIKIFELAAGVFEMRPLVFAIAILLGRFVRFMVEALLVIHYGPNMLHMALREFHRHSGIIFSCIGIVLLLIGVFVVRKLFAGKDTHFPVEGSSEVKSE